MNKNAKIVKTKDGSDTLFLPDLNEHYHSTNGARQESEHVYIKNGLDYYLKKYPTKKNIKILEVGFGTGINALVTQNYAEKNNISIEYTALEPFPLEMGLIRQLNFNFSIKEKQDYLTLHEINWNKKQKLSQYFILNKITSKIEDFEEKENYNIVYFDAFAPNKQKNIWYLGNLSKLNRVLYGESGILVTYCAQGQFKRDSKAAGFELETTKGPPGKYEMVRLLINKT